MRDQRTEPRRNAMYSLLSTRISESSLFPHTRSPLETAGFKMASAPSSPSLRDYNLQYYWLIPFFPNQTDLAHILHYIVAQSDSCCVLKQITKQSMIIPLHTFGARAVKDALRRPAAMGSTQEHLVAAVSWLERAQDITADDGVSYGYSLRGGWRPSYRETSGYIAVTFFDLAHRFSNPTYRQRAIDMCQWLCSVQNADGSFSNPSYDADRGIVFDTGQVLLGLSRAFVETRSAQFLDHARRAGQWLVEVADSEGLWTRNTFNGIPHAYNTRVAWSLLELNKLEHDVRLESIARANLDWAVSQQRNGHFDQCAFTSGVPPYTHTIAYTIRGLLESGLLLGEDKYVNSAELGASAILEHVRKDGYIPGRIDIDGIARSNYSCLTGNCQLAIIWAKLFSLTGDQRYKGPTISALKYVMTCQDVKCDNPDVRGAIKGSQPLWGGYCTFTYPNWAAKFFIDAMLLSQEWMTQDKPAS